MATLFRKASPLDFGIGYRWRQNESNLLLAERTADAQTASINPSLTTSTDGTQSVAVGSPDTPSWAKMHHESQKRSRGGLLRRLAKTAKRAQIAKTGFSSPSGANPLRFRPN